MKTCIIVLCILTLICLIETSYQCSCLPPLENLESLICDSDAFVRIKVISNAFGGGPLEDKYKVKILEVIYGRHFRPCKSYTIRTPSSSAACGASFSIGDEYYVALYDRNRVNLCGIISVSDLPAGLDPDDLCYEGDDSLCEDCVVCTQQLPQCEPDCYQCAISEQTCEECAEAVCCDLVDCMNISVCDDQSYVDFSHSCCPGECVNVCASTTCLEGQVCKAHQVECVTTPCNPVPLCVDDNSTICTQDAKFCCVDSTGEDIYVGRDPNNGCDFFPCPDECNQTCVVCPQVEPQCEAQCSQCAITPQTCEECSYATCCDLVLCAFLPECDEQSYLDRSENCCPEECTNVCLNTTCPIGEECIAEEVICVTAPCNPVPKCVPETYCTDDAKLCCDDIYVGRDPDNGCKFFPCPDECNATCVVCPQVVPQCEAGCSQCAITPQTCEECSYATCCDLVRCRMPPVCDEQSFLDRSEECCPEECTNVCLNTTCPDGEKCVAQEVLCINPPCNPVPACVAIEPEICNLELKECCAGFYVGRNQRNDCKFYPCPKECPTTYCQED